MESIKIKAPAKVNTHLKVIGKRPDGYHDLQMVMVPLTLADEIILKKTSDKIELELIGCGDEGMSGEKNLAYRAAAILKEKFEIKLGAKILLDKKTPIAAGLGGGSSDAGAVLRGLNKLWDLNLSTKELALLGKELGADVPFFCYGGVSYVEGIGDKVTPYDFFPTLAFLLINPGFSVSTPWVYRELGFQLTEKTSDARVPPRFQVFSDVLAHLKNDLEAVTIKAYPEIQKIKDRLLASGAAGALMSGSGPTVFALFENMELRDRALDRIKIENWRIFKAEGPVSID
jgi:4-diphosphocytidyl-2C-methyl-D-erythritol kinase